MQVWKLFFLCTAQKPAVFFTFACVAYRVHLRTTWIFFIEVDWINGSLHIHFPIKNNMVMSHLYMSAKELTVFKNELN